jgi:hypothetical protein
VAALPERPRDGEVRAGVDADVKDLERHATFMRLSEAPLQAQRWMPPARAVAISIVPCCRQKEAQE